MDEKHTAYPVAGSLTEQERHFIEAFYRAFSDKSPDLLNEAVVPDWQAPREYVIRTRWGNRYTEDGFRALWQRCMRPPREGRPTAFSFRGFAPERFRRKRVGARYFDAQSVVGTDEFQNILGFPYCSGPHSRAGDRRRDAQSLGSGATQATDALEFREARDRAGCLNLVGWNSAPVRVNAIHPGVVSDSPMWARSNTLLAGAQRRTIIKRLQRSFQDPLVAEIAFAIVSEMRTQAAGGRLLAETLAVSLAARLVHSRSGLSPNKDLEQLSHRGLDRRRLTRVREYIAANLEGDLTIAQLAKVACLSQFHFARAFKTATGQPPHQYVSALRLERAKEMLMRGDQPLLDIAIALNFSSQANFTRAFRVGTGMTPGQFRRDFARR